MHQDTLAAVDGLLQGAEQRAGFELRGRRPRTILTRSSPACRRPFLLLSCTPLTRQDKKTTNGKPGVSNWTQRGANALLSPSR
jgi:hypothetical protein